MACPGSPEPCTLLWGRWRGASHPGVPVLGTQLTGKLCRQISLLDLGHLSPPAAALAHAGTHSAPGEGREGRDAPSQARPFVGTSHPLVSWVPGSAFCRKGNHLAQVTGKILGGTGMGALAVGPGPLLLLVALPKVRLGWDEGVACRTRSRARLS